MSGPGFYGGNNQEGEGFFVGVSGSYVDVTVDLQPLEPVLSLTADVVTATFVDLAGSIVLPPVPDLDILGTAVTGKTVIPGALPPYSSGLDVILTTASGMVRHIGAEVEKLVTSRARKYGFENCTFELPAYLVKNYYQELAPFTFIQVINQGITCFEGRITDPGSTIGSDDSRRKIVARGHFDALSDDEAVRACYADSDFSDWRRPTKTPKHDFNIDATTGDTGAIGAGYIEAVAKWGSTYGASKLRGNDVGAWGDICWWLYNGIPITNGDSIAGIELSWSWNGLLDPSLILTSKLPRYNLFADPRGMSAANPWTRTKDNRTVLVGDVEVGGTVPKVATGYYHYDVGDNPDEYIVCGEYNAFVFWVKGNAEPDEGAAEWSHKMALPDDMKKRLKAGDNVPLGVSFFVAALNAPEGDTQDTAHLLIYDSNGATLVDWTLYEGLDDYAFNWKCFADYYDPLPADAASVELQITWGQDGGNGTLRYVALPCIGNLDPTSPLTLAEQVSNVSGRTFYQDGDSPGWIWTSQMNSSPSRESDLTVTEAVLQEVYSFYQTTPIWVTLFASNDPGAEPKNGVPAANQELAIWRDYKVSSGKLSVTCAGYTGLGISIAVVGCPYTLQFKAPDTGYQPPPYGLTIDSYTVYASDGMGDHGIDVEDCIRQVVASNLAIPVDEQLDFPDQAQVKAEQLNYPLASMPAAIIAKLDALIDWEYGFRDNGTFYYYDSDRLKADPRSIYQVPFSQAQMDVATQIDDICNGCEVTWTHADGITPGSQQVTQQTPWVPEGVQRIHHVDAPSEATYSDATALALAYLKQHTVPEITGNVPFTTLEVRDTNNALHNAMSMREGEYIRLIDMPREEQDYGLLLISRVTIDHDAMTVTAEVGMNRKRLDRQLARLDAKVVRR